MNQRTARPSRGGAQQEARPTRATRGTQESARPQGRTASAPATNQPASTGDAWDELDNMGKGSGGGDGTFNKMNTSFFLSNGEEANIVILDENPILFNGHQIQCITSNNKKFWRTEACQKSEQDYCVICDRKSKAIGKAYKVIAFRVLDERGTWDKDSNGFDYIPAPKIFLVPIYLAKSFKMLKDQAGTISDKIIKLKKDDKYMASFDMVNMRGGGMDYNWIPEDLLDGIELPEVHEVYAPMNDEELNEFLDEYVDTSEDNRPAGKGNNNQGNRGGGGFGGGGNARTGNATRANGRTGGGFGK